MLARVFSVSDGQWILLTAITLCLLPVCSGSRCQCKPLTCQPPQNCSQGTVSDSCGCCQVCARALHEECGGRGDSFGMCGDRMECVLNATPGARILGDETGVCEEMPETCDSFICGFKVQTHRCPSDSMLIFNGTLDPGSCCRTSYECQCDQTACKVPRCAASHSLQLLRKSSGKPGFCCDLYQCRVSGCQSTSGEVYKNLETWQEGNCVTCLCVDGKKRCQAQMCVKTCPNPRHVPGRCCPVCDTRPDQLENQTVCSGRELSSCNFDCPMGLRVGKDGCPICRCRPDGCDKECRYGYVESVNGEELCECMTPPELCPSMPHCTKRCQHGFKISRNGCPKCRCNKCPIVNCENSCYHGYQKDWNGCQVCKCIEPPVTKTCLYSGMRYNTGETWKTLNCTECLCRHDGTTLCGPVSCPMSCAVLVKREGHCCPVCLNVSLSSIQTDGDSMQSDKKHTAELTEMEERYIISLSIAGVFVVLLLVLVFVLIYLRLKHKHKARWSIPRKDSQCACPLFSEHSPQNKYNFNGDLATHKLTFDPVVVEKYQHPCIEVKPDEETKKFILSSPDSMYDKTTVGLKSDYRYDHDWSEM